MIMPPDTKLYPESKVNIKYLPYLASYPHPLLRVVGDPRDRGVIVIRRDVGEFVGR